MAANNVQYTFTIRGLDKLNEAENNLKTLTKQLNSNKKAQEVLNHTQKKNAAQVAALTEEYKRNKEKQEIARQEKKKYADALKREVAVRQAVRGSIGKVNALLAVEKQRIKDVVVGSAQYKVMATRIKNLETRQRAFNVQMGRSGTFVGEYARGFKQGFAQIGIAIAGALAAFRGLQRIIGGSLEAYAKQEAAERSLAIALGGTSTAILNQASAIQKKSTFGDEELIQGAAFLAQLGSTEKEIQKLLPSIADFAAAKGIDLKTASDLVSKSVNSETNALSRYGVVIKGEVGSVERLESAVTSLDNAFGGQAEALSDVDGGLTQLGNTAGDAQEQFGRLVSVLLDKFLPSINEALSATNTFNDILLDGIENGESFIEMGANIYATLAGDQVNAIADQLEQGLITQEEFNRRTLLLAQKNGKDQASAFVKAVQNRIAEIRELEEADRLKKEAKELQDLEAQQKRLTEKYIAEKKKEKALRLKLEKDTLDAIQSLRDKTEEEEKEEEERKKALADALAFDASTLMEEEVDVDADKEERITNKQVEESNKRREINKQESEERKELAINAAEQISSATLQIIGQRAKKENELEAQRLKEKKESGLITEDEYNRGIVAIEKKAFKQKQTADIAQALINGALAITKILAQTGVLSPPAIAAAGITTAAQVAAIGAQKFAKGGVLIGNSHAFGGIPTPFGEMEGEEAVINKKSTAMFKPLLSQINQAGGGVKFADGGITPNQNIQQVQSFDIAAQLRNLKVINVATETTDLAIFVENEQAADNF